MELKSLTWTTAKSARTATTAILRVAKRLVVTRLAARENLATKSLCLSTNGKRPKDAHCNAGTHAWTHMHAAA